MPMVTRQQTAHVRTRAQRMRRLAMLPRTVITITGNKTNVVLKLTIVDGGQCVASVAAKELTQFGVRGPLSTLAAGYLHGMLLARRALITLKQHVFYPPSTCMRVRHRYRRNCWHAATARDHPAMNAMLDADAPIVSFGSRQWATLLGVCDGGVDVDAATNTRDALQRADAMTVEQRHTQRMRIAGDDVVKLLEAPANAFGKPWRDAGIDAQDVRVMYAKARAMIVEMGGTKTFALRSTRTRQVQHVLMAKALHNKRFRRTQKYRRRERLDNA